MLEINFFMLASYHTFWELSTMLWEIFHYFFVSISTAKLFSLNFLTVIVFEFIIKKNQTTSEVKYGYKKVKPDDTHCKNAL